MALLFQLSPNSDSEGTDFKVDSIGWVRDDSIVVGCVRLNEESNEEGYLVKVIRSGGDTFFESSSKPIVLSYDVFGGIRNDILPSGVGPNLLLGYLHCWDLLVVTNKKCTDDHISLLKWPSRTDEERTVVYLEMVDDRYSPRIDLQENDDHNVILGFGVENVSLFQKITLVGPEQEVAPQHLLLCLTSEGKLIIYYLARISDPSDLPQTSLSTIEDSNVDKQISPATASNKNLTPSVTSSSAKSLLAGPGTVATHDSSKAKKPRGPEESCRKMFSAVLEKYKVECENYDDKQIICSKDKDVLLRIEMTLRAPDCDKPTDYNKLIEELQTVTKRMVARKYARDRDVLVKNLLLVIDKICHFESDMPFVDPQKKIAALQAKDWLLKKQKEQESVSIYEDAVLKCVAVDNWIKRLNLDQTTEGSLLEEFKSDSIEVFQFDPNQEGALQNFVTQYSNRMSIHPQAYTFEYEGHRCRLLEYQCPDKQPPRWMLIELVKDVVSLSGLYFRSDNSYLSAFSNKKGTIYELVVDDSMRMIPNSHVFGFGHDYPSLMNFEKPATLPSGAYQQRLMNILLNKESFLHGMEVLSNYDHTVLEDPTLTDAQKQLIMKEVLEALAWNAVVLAEVACILELFVSVNQNWNELRSSLTGVLFQLMMHWNKLSEKVRNKDDSPFPESISSLTYLYFRRDAIRVLNLVLNGRGPGPRSKAPRDDGKGSEDPGSSGGDDEEHNISGSSSGPTKDKRLNMPGSGLRDSSHENLGGGHYSGKQTHYHDGRSETIETCKAQMAFMTGLVIGKNMIQPMIRQKGMESFVITKRGPELSIISRRSDPLEAQETGLAEVLSLLQDSSTSSSGYEELPEGSSVEEQTNKFPSRPEIFTPPRSVPSGETLLEIFRVETNLALIKTILVYDYKGATLVYKSKQGDKSRFCRKRSNWLSKNTKKASSDFIDSLILTGPTRPMTADGESWVIKLDVPAESSLGVEDPELRDKLFKAILPLSSDYIDKPRCSLLSIRGGVVNISSITFSNALRCTVRFILDRRADVSAKQFYIRGEVTLSLEDYNAKFTLFRSQLPKVTARILSETKVEIPLLRDVLSLPVGARVHVEGILKLRRGKVLIDDHLILDKETVEAEWPVISLNGVASPSQLKACLSIALCDYI
ncbi:hypothetical protein ACQJBY_019153 [Aegilops geniculata]